MKPSKKPRTIAMFLSAALAAAPFTAALAQNDGAKPTGAAAPAAATPAAAPAAPKPVSPDTVVLSVGDEKMTAAQFNDFVAGLPPQYQQAAESDPSVRRQLADGFIRVRLLAAEARKQGLDKADKTKVLLQLAQDQVLAQAIADQAVSDEAIKAHLAANTDLVTARHILISTRATGGGKALSDEEAKKKADSIRDRLTKGEDFAKVCAAESDDPGSKNTGGVYTFPKGQMVKEFEETAFALKENEISQPVKTQFGYHVIQRLAPDLKQMRPQIEREIAPKKMDALLADLKAKNPTVLNPDYFGAEPAATPGAPGAAAPGGATPPPPAEKK